MGLPEEPRQESVEELFAKYDAEAFKTFGYLEEEKSSAPPLIVEVPPTSEVPDVVDTETDPDDEARLSSTPSSVEPVEPKGVNLLLASPQWVPPSKNETNPELVEKDEVATKDQAWSDHRGAFDLLILGVPKNAIQEQDADLDPVMSVDARSSETKPFDEDEKEVWFDERGVFDIPMSPVVATEKENDEPMLEAAEANTEETKDNEPSCDKAREDEPSAEEERRENLDDIPKVQATTKEEEPKTTYESLTGIRKRQARRLVESRDDVPELASTISSEFPPALSDDDWQFAAAKADELVNQLKEVASTVSEWISTQVASIAQTSGTGGFACDASSLDHV